MAEIRSEWPRQTGEEVKTEFCPALKKKKKKKKMSLEKIR